MPNSVVGPRHAGHETSRREKPCDTPRRVPCGFSGSAPDSDSVTHDHKLSVPRRDVHGITLAFTAHDRRKSGAFVDEPNNVAALQQCTSEGRACGTAATKCSAPFSRQADCKLGGKRRTYRSSCWRQGQQEARRYCAFFIAELAIACHNDRGVGLGA